MCIRDRRYTDCYIDIGLHSKEEVLKYVDVGDVACYEGPYTELAPGYITAKAIDDRVGCYMLLAAIMNVKKPKNDVYLCLLYTSHTVGVENLEVVNLFARAGELDGLAGDGLNGKRRTAAGIAVELC